MMFGFRFLSLSGRTFANVQTKNGDEAQCYLKIVYNKQSIGGLLHFAEQLAARTPTHDDVETESQQYEYFESSLFDRENDSDIIRTGAAVCIKENFVESTKMIDDYRW